MSQEDALDTSLSIGGSRERRSRTHRSPYRLDAPENSDHDASMQRYLVTGCAGFIGSHLTETLLAAEAAVVGIDAFTDYYPRELKEANLEGVRANPKFTFVEADLTVAPLAELLDDVDGIFHLAAQ